MSTRARQEGVCRVINSPSSDQMYLGVWLTPWAVKCPAGFAVLETLGALKSADGDPGPHATRNPARRLAVYGSSSHRVHACEVTYVV